MMIKKLQIPKILFLLIVFISKNLIALDTATIDAIHQGGHTYTVIDSYAPVHAKAKDLLKQGVSFCKIVLLTDWDDVVPGPGAWLQKDYQGNHICPQTKRMLREHEVDGTLRDPKVPELLEDLTNSGIPVIVITARPPIIDIDIPKLAGVEHDNLLDVRHPENPDLIDYERIAGVVTRVINATGEKKLLRLTKEKVEEMARKSGVDLRGQGGLDVSLVHTLNQNDASLRKMVYHDGYAFVAHDKGPYAYGLINLMDEGHFPEHLLIVDDGTRAMASYIRVLDQFKAKGTTVHLFHYPIPMRPQGILA